VGGRNGKVKGDCLQFLGGDHRPCIWRIKRKNRSNGLAYRRAEGAKSVVNFEQEGCIFHPYEEQKPPGQIKPKSFGDRRPRLNHTIHIC